MDFVEQCLNECLKNVEELMLVRLNMNLLKFYSINKEIEMTTYLEFLIKNLNAKFNRFLQSFEKVENVADFLKPMLIRKHCEKCLILIEKKEFLKFKIIFINLVPFLMLDNQYFTCIFTRSQWTLFTKNLIRRTVIPLSQVTMGSY